jgi:parallel beta-helix repeat protein
MPKSFRPSAHFTPAEPPEPQSESAPALQLESLESRTMLTVFSVTNTNDGGAGSLRDALTQSNNHAGVDTIEFHIASSSKVIRPSSPLPEVWDPAAIDGTTQAGYAGKPLVQVDGANAGAKANGFKLWGGSTLKGLSVTNFAVDGVDLLNRGKLAGNVVRGMWIGLDLAGNAAGNHGQSLLIWKSANNVVGGINAGDRNVISGSRNHGTLGVLIIGAAATNNRIEGNYIGTDPTGTLARPNAGTGVGIQDAPNNLIARNLISGNGEDGILIFKSGATGNAVQGNLIGTDASGTRAIPNGMYGIEIQSANNAVGGKRGRMLNVISGNAKAGVVLWTAGATWNTIRGNYIGTNVRGTAKVANGEQGVALSGASGNAIRGNLIAGNKLEGVGIFTSGNNSVTWNTIGFSATGARLTNGTWAFTMVGGSNLNLVTSNVIATHPTALFQNSGAGNRIVANTVR